MTPPYYTMADAAQEFGVMQQNIRTWYSRGYFSRAMEKVPNLNRKPKGPTEIFAWVGEDITVIRKELAKRVEDYKKDPRYKPPLSEAAKALIGTTVPLTTPTKKTRRTSFIGSSLEDLMGEPAPAVPAPAAPPPSLDDHFEVLAGVLDAQVSALRAEVKELRAQVARLQAAAREPQPEEPRHAPRASQATAGKTMSEHVRDDVRAVLSATGLAPPRPAQAKAPDFSVHLPGTWND